MLWIEVPNTTQRAVSSWQRSAGMAEDGEVFVPAAVSGNEEMAVLSASYDGEKVILYKKHAFLRTTWVAKEYPKTQELCQKIERRVRDAAASAPPD